MPQLVPWQKVKPLGLRLATSFRPEAPLSGTEGPPLDENQGSHLGEAPSLPREEKGPDTLLSSKERGQCLDGNTN